MGKQQCDGQVSTKRGITPDRRYVAAEWMYQICERLYPKRELSRAVFHLSVHILDSVLITPQEYLGIPLIENTLQLIGLSAIELSIEHLYQKRFLIARPRSEDMLSFCGDKYTAREFCYSQNRIEMLKPFEGVVTSIDWFYKYLAEGLSEGTSVQNLALALMDSFILDHSTRKYHPQLVTLAGIAVARRLIFKEAEQWTSQLTSISGYTISDFQLCYDHMFYVAYLLFKEDDNATETPVSSNEVVFSKQATLVH